MSVADSKTDDGRLRILDGWRAVSILAVLAGHLLPLNAVVTHANEAAGLFGMAVFFTLSGFLITRFLIDRPDAKAFIIRRILRIVPLAWAGVVAAYFVGGALDPVSHLFANLFFYANVPPMQLLSAAPHFWSLDVEVQFYVAIALAVAVIGRRALIALPVLAFAVTLARVASGTSYSIATLLRIDEIFAGATLALIWSGWFGEKIKQLVTSANTLAAAVLAFAACYWFDTPLAYLRPYAVALLVGSTLAQVPRLLAKPMLSRPAIYIAAVSYALYVVHGILTDTWLGEGDDLVKYAKRPLLLGATFGIAHLSTYYFEAHFIALGRRLTRRAPVTPKPAMR